MILSHTFLLVQKTRNKKKYSIKINTFKLPSQHFITLYFRTFELFLQKKPKNNLVKDFSNMCTYS